MAHEVRISPIYEFVPFRLDAGKHVLTKDGEKVHLGPRPIGVLLALVERAGQVVTEDDLLKVVWGDKAYDLEANDVTQQIHILRRALGEKPGDNKYIATFPGEGYKFVAQVKIVPTPNGGPNVEGDRDIAGVRAGGKAGDSIVVLCEDDAHLVDARGTVIRVGDSIMLDTVDEAGNRSPSPARVFRACTNSDELLVAQEGFVVGILKLDGGNFFVESDAMADPDRMVKVTIVGGRGKIPAAPVVDGTGKVLTVPSLPATQRAFVIPKDLMKKT